MFRKAAPADANAKKGKKKKTATEAPVTTNIIAPNKAQAAAGLQGNSIVSAIQGAGFKLQVVDKADYDKMEAPEGWAKWDQLDKAKQGAKKK